MQRTGESFVKGILGRRFDWGHYSAVEYLRRQERGMTAADFRRIALGFEGTEEGAHMGAVDFRVDGRIFATLAHVKEDYGNLMFSPEQQRDFCAESPKVFLPIAGGWGRMGCTHIRLAAATEDEMAGALHAAWRRRVELNKKPAAKRVAMKTTKRVR